MVQSTHPALNGGTFGAMSGEKPLFPASVKPTHEKLVKTLKQMGLKFEETHGKYGQPERSVIIHKPTIKQMAILGKLFGQESVVHSVGGRHVLLYTNGPFEGRYRTTQPGKPPHELFSQVPENDYTYLPGHGYFRINFDFSHDTPPHELDPVKPMAKNESSMKGVMPHPHAYEWHDGHTSHHDAILKADNPVNEQAAGVGVHSYRRFAAPYGHVNPRQPSNLLFYPYHDKLPQIEKLVKDHGYQTYYAGGKYGKPDLASKNYNTGHLMIYDPTPASGGDFGHEAYTRGWRQIHELAHALTYPELNKIYGEGRRIGKLGTHRTLNEAMRAVHWEHLAAHKQRELSKQIGVHIPDEDFNKEYNTVMHDAVHRAVTGKFTEPSQEGFVPHSHAVPLTHALDTLREEAGKMGLAHPNALSKSQSPVISNTSRSTTVADEKTFTPEDAAAIASEYFQKRIGELAKHIKDLRERELAKTEKKVEKSLIPPHQHSGGGTVGGATNCVSAAQQGSSYGEESSGEESSVEDSAHEGEESSGEESSGDLEKDDSVVGGDMGSPTGVSNVELGKSESCKKCNKSHPMDKGCYMDKADKKGVKKAMLADAKGKVKDNGIHPDSVLPDDKKSEEVSADGSGGDVKKGKSLKKSDLAGLRARAAHRKAEPLSKRPVSEAQRGAMGAAAAGKGKLDIPELVGKEFIAKDPGGKLPEKKKKAKKAEPPMAKPPSGKNMGTHVPTSAPKAMAKSEKPGIFGRLNKDPKASSPALAPFPEIKPHVPAKTISGAPSFEAEKTKGARPSKVEKGLVADDAARAQEK